MAKFTRGEFLELRAGAGLGLAGVGRSAAAQSSSMDAAPDLVVVNGRVFTVDEDLPEAFAVKNGRSWPSGARTTSVISWARGPRSSLARHDGDTGLHRRPHPPRVGRCRNTPPSANIFIATAGATRAQRRISFLNYGVVAEVDGRIVGSNFLDERASFVGLGPITIDPDVQNAKIGRELMVHAIDWVRSRGRPGVCTDTADAASSRTASRWVRRTSSSTRGERLRERHRLH